jgi:hypothetical protein
VIDPNALADERRHGLGKILEPRMPTLDWIRESAVDRYSEYLSTLDHEKRRVHCPYCPSLFDDAAALGAHVGLKHPLGIPDLFVGGRSAPSAVIVRRVLSPEDFVLLNCTGCRVESEGKAFQLRPRDLPGWLADKQPAHAHLVLENVRPASGTRTASELRIEFRIPSESDLDRCDREFLMHLARPSFLMDDVETYVKSVPQGGMSREYSAALADYAIGVLLKEQSPASGILGAQHEHKDKFMSALEVLAGFVRPISEAVTSAIAFNLNAWDRLQPPPELPAFVRAAEFFRKLDGLGPNDYTLDGESRPICPVDRMTDMLLAAIRAMPETAAGRPVPAAIGALFDTRADLLVTEFDLVKRAVIRSVVALRLRDKATARRSLIDVRHDHHFGVWAEEKLQELK